MRSRQNLNASIGMGLTNITDRYQLLSKQSIEVEEFQNYFIVKLPILA